GSTGKPKGILHTHKSASVFIDWATDFLKLNENDVISHKSSIDFDLSVFDIFATIKSGAKLTVIPEYLYNHPTKIIDYIVKKKVTVFYSVPSTILNGLNTILLGEIKKSNLRHIIFAGEQISKMPLHNLYSNLPINCTIHNWYGPTETNVCSYHEISQKSFDDHDEIPIGKPCPYAKFNLIESDQHKKELLIKSISTMQRYWSKSHRINNFYLLNDEHYYRSGDLVSQSNDNEFTFLGRIDRQVKLRGYRIQLEEIEYSALQLKSIREAITIVLDDQLYLCIVTDNKIFTEAQVTQHLSTRLASYMLPDKIIFLTYIPRNNRGKINYHELNDMLQNQEKTILC
ncbi:MAG: AMP-binding protein, partial [Gammaproteobacteria bacterium]